MDVQILVLDDEGHLRRMMRITREPSGYTVAEASDGDEGLRFFGDGSRIDDGLAVRVTADGTIELGVDAAPAQRSGGASLPGQSAVGAPSVQLRPLETWTTNGFFFHRTGEAAVTWQPVEHHFLVRRGNEADGTAVVVTIDPKAAARLSKQCGRDLKPGGTFWRQQAETALLNYLWSEARVPDGGQLVISRVTGAMLDEASVWLED
jgi:hypothetical protein